MKSHEWLDRVLESADPIEQFSNAWRGFNGLFSSNDKVSELCKIHNYLVANVSEDTATEIIEAHEGEIDYLLSMPVVDMRGNGKNTSENINSYKKTSSNFQRVNSIICIIYQIRCNLEHGQKSPTRERDVELCRSSWPIVAEIIDKCT